MSSKLFLKISVFIITIIFFNTILFSKKNANFKSTSSKVKIDAGASLVLDTQMTDVMGTIIKSDGAFLSGEDIVFVSGNYEDSGNKLQVQGNLEFGQSNKIKLNGNQKFKGKSGIVLQEIEVGGKGNLLAGDFITQSDISLQDSNASVSFDVINKVTGDIRLNGGEAYFLSDIKFIDGKRIVGPGKVNLNGHKLLLGAQNLVCSESINFENAGDVELTSNVDLDAVWSFNGTSVIQGNNSFLSLGDNGKIIVEDGSTLLVKNLIFPDVRNDSIFCMDDAGTFSFQDVEWYQNTDYTFSIGHFNICHKMKMGGESYKFTYNASRVSTIQQRSILYLDRNFTFSYDPGIMNTDLISFENNASVLYLNGATLHATLTGMQLTKGTLLIERVSSLCSEKTLDIDVGICIGNGTEDDDMNVQFCSASRLDVSHGSLLYRNISSGSWLMQGHNSVLKIYTGAKLGLYQNLDLGPGRLCCSNNCIVARSSGKDIAGTVNAQGGIIFDDL